MDLSYEKILLRAAHEADQFSLTWRHEFEFSKSAALIEEKLRPHQSSEKITSKWPGTELIGGTAVVRTYCVNKTTLSILAQVPDLFSWLAPKYPEDLALYKKGRLLFWSIAHEKEAGFEP